MEYVKNAYAKINLTLEVFEKREDGYHEMRSVMQKISLCDELTFVPNLSKEIHVFCDRAVCDEKENLAYRAAELYKNEYVACGGENFGIDIYIKKNIPEKAGLAGGSADAACTLDALFAIFSKVDYATVEKMAGALGSDVPFCLEKYSCAHAYGTGTSLQSLPSLSKDISVLVAMPKEGLSTKGIYASFDENPNYCPFNCTDNMIESLKTKDIQKSFENIFNAFFPISEQRCPQITEIKKLFVKNGAAVSEMSGSGAAVFGLFMDKDKAQKCMEELSKDYFCAHTFPI